MADRRMFSKRVIGSARFLRMPGSTQALYFHLGMAADDDGIVEAYPIMQMVNASEDDLRLLAAKGFVKVLNEDLVTYILDWQENNKIRADRKVNSIYKDLLLQIMPDTSLIEPRQRADRVPKDAILDAVFEEDEPVAEQPRDNQGTSVGQPWDVPLASLGQPRDNHGTPMGRHRIGEDRIGKDRVVYAAAAARDDPLEEKDLGEVVRTFEENIHPITGGIERDKFIDLTNEYGALWVKSAIEEAAISGGRNLRYITAILERWKREGFKAPRKKGGGNYGTGIIQGHMAGDGAEKSPYAAYFDGDAGTGAGDIAGGTTTESRDPPSDLRLTGTGSFGCGASSGGGSGAYQTRA